MAASASANMAALEIGLSEDKTDELLFAMEQICQIRPGVVLVGDRLGGQMEVISRLTDLPFEGQDYVLGRCPIWVITIKENGRDWWKVDVVYDWERADGGDGDWVPSKRSVRPVRSETIFTDQDRHKAVAAVREAQDLALGGMRQFSPNAVRLQVSGNFVGPRSLYVAPGICLKPLYPENGDEPRSIQEYAADLITQPGTRTLLCVRSTDGLETSKAVSMGASLSREQGFEGHVNVVIVQDNHPGAPQSFNGLGVEHRYSRAEVTTLVTDNMRGYRHGYLGLRLKKTSLPAWGNWKLENLRDYRGVGEGPSRYGDKLLPDIVKELVEGGFMKRRSCG
ncbi:hypothetical protein GE09DRAFT_1231921 [Coniochaeta sp. 2T2.1]|nr:hypothetical protein GE09DRAFT_1231921 [Coniochaeta sp. 2T2.1]